MFVTLVLCLFYFDDFLLELELVEDLPADFGLAFVTGVALVAEVFFTGAFGAAAFAFGFGSDFLAREESSSAKAFFALFCNFSNSS
jgi:hypothetical protein